MICSNIGRKSDRIITGKERLRRAWFFKRFRVRFFFPKRKDRCHALRKHGPQYNIHAQHDRTQGRSDKRMGESPFASRFYSHEKMWEAREAFLRQNEQAMKDMAAAIEAGRLTRNKPFTGDVRMSTPIGEGLVRIGQVEIMKGKQATGDPGVKHFSNITTAHFSYRYENGQWYEGTAYPNVKVAFREVVKSGPTIHL